MYEVLFLLVFLVVFLTPAPSMPAVRINLLWNWLRS